MKPPQVDLPPIWRGCDWPAITFNWKDANGNPFNLQHWVPIASSNGFDLGVQVTNAAGGVTQMSLSKDATTLLKLGVFQWNWIWQYVGSPPNVNIPILAGNVEVKNPILPAYSPLPI